MASLPKHIRGEPEISEPYCREGRVPVMDCKGSVKQCLNPPDRPPTPENTLIFDKWNNPKVGDHRIFHAMIKDPQLEQARNMIHGIKLNHDIGAQHSLHPKELTPLQYLIKNQKEAIYESSKKKPLGTSPKPNLPDFIDPINTTLGVPLNRSEKIKPLLNPDKRRIDILKEEQRDHDVYLKPYKHLLPGEQAHRNYTNAFDSNKMYGIPSGADITGKFARRAMDWSSQETQKIPMASERLMEYFDRNHSQLGKTLDRIRDTLNVPKDFTFGKASPDGNGSVGQLLRGHAYKHLLGLTAPTAKSMNDGPEADRRCVTLAEREAILRATLKQQLRRHLFKRGPEITAVLCQLAEGERFIAEDLVQAVYEEFDPPLDEELREELFDVARGENFASSDSKLVEPATSRHSEAPRTIDWKLFASLLDWNRLEPFERGGHEDCMKEDPCVPSLTERAEIVRKRLGTAAKQRLIKWRTTNATYQGDRAGLLDNRLWRTLGAPSYLRDYTVPCPIKVYEKRNFADSGGVATLINPALMSTLNIGQRDMFILRDKQEMKNIIERSGVTSEIEGGCEFEDLWARAKCLDQERLRELAPSEDCDRATLDSFRQAIRECNLKKVTAAVNQRYQPCCT
uniref:EF-hand domain-containing family member B n=4 Tax=Schistocephalus solidus TaxID=70667 RepID=A0A0X3PX35_SCHSO